jgi:hypothetical protein
LDFSKADDKVNWSFLFDHMNKFGIPTKLVKMMKMFFQGANSNITMNGKASKALVIKRGVQQGCPLAPYLFLIVGEAINAKNL